MEFSGPGFEAQELLEGVAHEGFITRSRGRSRQVEGDVRSAVADQSAIEQGQRLLGHDAGLAPVAVLDQGLVEGGEEEVPVVVGMLEIQAAPAGLRLIRRTDRRPASCRIEASRVGQKCIPDDLRFQADGRASPPQSVVGIAGEFRPGAGQRGIHAVGGRGDDEPVEVLEAPASVDEFAGQPVDQVGVFRRAAFASEIKQRRGQGRSEMSIPHLIHRHPCSQGISRVGDPAG